MVNYKFTIIIATIEVGFKHNCFKKLKKFTKSLIILILYNKEIKLFFFFFINCNDFTICKENIYNIHN